MAKIPTIQALDTAVQWLMTNEGDAKALGPNEPTEAEECQAVAAWIESRIKARCKAEAMRNAEQIFRNRREARLRENTRQAIESIKVG